MRNLHAALLITGALLAFILFSGNSGGRIGRTGAPSTGGGTEGTCGTCHSGGAFGEPTLAWTIADQMGTPVTAYIPGQTYSVTLAITAPNANPAAYGFSAVFLDDTEAPNGSMAQQAGSFSNLDANMRQQNSSGRDYIVHSQRTASGTWTFDWTAPAAGFGEVRIYSTGNAVNSNFNTGGDNGSTAPTIITLPEDNTLPVTLNAFSAEAEKTTVTLSWETSSEDNVSHFELERSTNGIDFTYLQEIMPKGELAAITTYAIEDEVVTGGQYYYRLKMIDLNGSFEYSPLATVVVEAANGLRFYPNPTADFINIPQVEGNSVRLLDSNGRVLRANMQSGAHDLRNLKAGVYFLESTDGKSRSVQQLVKK